MNERFCDQALMRMYQIPTTDLNSEVMSDRYRVADEDDEQYVITPVPEAPPAPSHGHPRVADDDASVAFRCEYEGAVSGLASSVFRLRILDDATLEGDVLRPYKPHSDEDKTHKRPKLSSSMMMKRSNGDQVARQHDGLALYAHLEGRVKPLYAAQHKRPPSLRNNDAYCCYFDVLLSDAQRHTEDDDNEEEAITCHMHFNPQQGDLRGHWVRHSKKPFWITADAPCELYYQEIKHEFQLKRRAAVNSEARLEDKSSAFKHEDHKQQFNETNRLKLYPLSPGLYELHGFSTIAPAPVPRSSRTMTTTSGSPSRRRRRSLEQPVKLTKDECFVTLRLLPDGTLKGTSRELLRPQSCKLTGSWRADRVRYTLEYRVRGEVGLFKYSGRIEGDSKILGKWKNVDEGHQEGYDGGKGEFELKLTQAARIKQEKKSGGDDQETLALDDDGDDGDDGLVAVIQNKIHVLTTGSYTLKGCATDDDGYEYACELVVHLQPGGSLVGTSRELIFDQTHRIEGKWEPRGLAYEQKYVVKGDVGEYTYAGTVDADCGIISGEWNNMEEQDQETRGEKGTFAYGIVASHRLWSAFSHIWYPKSFLRGVMMVLLCSLRTHALPSSLWYRVFEFCHESWFVHANAVLVADFKKSEV